MNSVERIRHELRSIQARDCMARIRRQLHAWPDDPDLRWALAELERSEPSLRRSPPRKRRTAQPMRRLHAPLR